MYKELRNYGSDPDVWAKPLFSGRIPLIDALRIRFISKDIRWKYIEGKLSSGAKVLDAGCGLGEWVIFMSRKGLRPIGMDYSQKLISFLESRFPKQQWKRGAVQDLPFSPGDFDAVISWGVIEHDEAGPQKAIKEFYRVLKSGGRLFLTVPIDTLAQRRSSAVIFGNLNNEGKFFQYFLTPDELKNFILQAGFEVEQILATSRHYALVFPGLYRRLVAACPLLSRLIGLLLKPLLISNKKALNIIFAVARKH